MACSGADWLTLSSPDHTRYWRRDPRLDCPRGEDERLVRQHEGAVAGDNEQDVENGGEDGCWLESLVRLLRRCHTAILVRVVILSWISTIVSNVHGYICMGLVVVSYGISMAFGRVFEGTDILLYRQKTCHNRHVMPKGVSLMKKSKCLPQRCISYHLWRAYDP